VNKENVYPADKVTEWQTEAKTDSTIEFLQTKRDILQGKRILRLQTFQTIILHIRQ